MADVSPTDLATLINDTRTALRRAADLITPTPATGPALNSAALTAAHRALTAHQAARPNGAFTGQGASRYNTALQTSTDTLAGYRSADHKFTEGYDQAAASAHAVRTKLAGIVTDTDHGIQALLPTTDTPAGRSQLASYLHNQLGNARTALAAAQLHSSAAGATLAAAAAGYHPPQSHIDPKPPPDQHRGPPCWVPNPGAGPALCPPDTDSYLHVDKDGTWTEQSPTGEILNQWGPGNTRPDVPEVCWLAGPHSDRSVCGPATTLWTYPDDHGNLVTERIGPGGTHTIPWAPHPYGPLNP